MSSRLVIEPIASEEALSEGEFVHVCIDGLIDGDLSGYMLED